MNLSKNNAGINQSPKNPKDNELNQIKVIRKTYDSLILYDVSDDELNELEKGSPESSYLNFSIFLLSTGISFLVNLIINKVESIYVFIVLTLITICSIIIGLFLLILWIQNKKLRKNVIRKIKNRKQYVEEYTKQKNASKR